MRWEVGKGYKLNAKKKSKSRNTLTEAFFLYNYVYFFLVFIIQTHPFAFFLSFFFIGKCSRISRFGLRMEMQKQQRIKRGDIERTMNPAAMHELGNDALKPSWAPQFNTSMSVANFCLSRTDNHHTTLYSLLHATPFSFIFLKFQSTTMQLSPLNRVISQYFTCFSFRIPLLTRSFPRGEYQGTSISAHPGYSIS